MSGRENFLRDTQEYDVMVLPVSMASVQEKNIKQLQVITIFEHIFTPCLKTCLHNVQRYNYTMLEDMTKPYLKTSFHHVYNFQNVLKKS